MFHNPPTNTKALPLATENQLQQDGLRRDREAEGHVQGARAEESQGRRQEEEEEGSQASGCCQRRRGSSGLCWSGAGHQPHRTAAWVALF